MAAFPFFSPGPVPLSPERPHFLRVTLFKNSLQHGHDAVCCGFKAHDFFDICTTKLPGFKKKIEMMFRKHDQNQMQIAI